MILDCLKHNKKMLSKILHSFGKDERFSEVINKTTIKDFCDYCEEYKKVNICEIRDKTTDNYTGSALICDECIKNCSDEETFIKV